jgi:antitoxin PrlF
MPIATMTSKGQLTIPKSIRDALGLATGAEVEFTLVDGGRATMRARRGGVERLFGLVAYQGPPVAVASMDPGSESR